jgi:FAD binding domain/Berberine and berberine like
MANREVGPRRQITGGTWNASPDPGFLSRREFVKLAGATGSALALEGAGLLDCARAEQVPRTVAAGVELSERTIRDFAGGLHGTLFRPSDSGYEAARRIWNSRFDRHPALIAQCADVADLQRAIQFARAERLALAVRSGGHSFAGDSVCDDGLVIDLSRMKSIRVDRARSVVEAQPGVVTSELAVATEPAGLALVLGGCGGVGIAGFTLGGGQGSLMEKYGLACDNLISADVVLADGQLVTASAKSHADLFWGLRGGGGNFGVVTSFRVRAQSLTTILAGRLTYAFTQAEVVMRGYREFAASAPDELGAGFGVAGGKDGPTFSLNVQYAGDAASAEPVLRTLRGLARPIADTIAPVSYHAFKSRPGPPAGFPSTIATAFLPDIGDDVIEAMVALGRSAPPGSVLDINHLHGAVSRVAPGETAFPLRQPGFDTFALAGWALPERRDAAIAWVGRFRDIVRPNARGAYVNALDEEDGRVKEAYGSLYPRLTLLKKKYDPANVFRFNRNVSAD